MSKARKAAQPAVKPPPGSGACGVSGCGQPGRHQGYCAAHWPAHRNEEA